MSVCQAGLKDLRILKALERKDLRAARKKGSMRPRYPRRRLALRPTFGKTAVMRFIAHLLVGIFSSVPLIACIWDSDSLGSEKRKSPDMAALILGSQRERTDTNRLIKRIEALKTTPRETEAAWHNELAGAYLRLGRAQEAASVLEPAATRFPDDYGIHANLGTAYHLLGRYQDAERHIARDLELNPEAHFGLEVYHLALLQYLSRDKDYQARHVYVDEFTRDFLEARFLKASGDQGLAGTNAASNNTQVNELERELATTTDAAERYQLLLQLVALDPTPPYRSKWNLATSTNFHKGVQYMAELNPREPACFVMLGVACVKERDLNLAAAAFKRAVALGSPQHELLQARIRNIQEHVSEARMYHLKRWLPLAFGGMFVGLLLFIAYRRQQRAVRDPYGDASSKTPGGVR